MSEARVRVRSLVALVLLGCALYVPSFATPQFHGEEARRAIPAREMMASGNYVLPTIWGRAYLTKPPLLYWLVAGTARLTGAVNEVSTRLPSLISTLLTALLVYVWGAALFGEGAALAAGVLFLLSLNVLGKGTVGEMEPPFTLAVLASLALLWSGRHGRWHALVAAGLALGAALLLKGPAALLFFAAAAVGIAAGDGGVRFLRSPRPLLPLVLGLLLVGAWAWLLLRQPGTREALDVWLAESTRAGGLSGPRAYWPARFEFLAAVLGAYLPSTLLLALAVGTAAGRRLSRDPQARFLGVALGLSLAYFVLAPGARPRYVYPVVPLACLLAGAFVAGALRDEADPAARTRLRLLAGVLLAAGVLATAGAGLSFPLHPIAGVDPLRPIGIALALAVLAVSLSGLVQVRGGKTRSALVHAVAAVVLLRLFQLAVIVPQVEGERLHPARMAQLERAIPPQQEVGLHVEAMWNELVYLRRPLRWVEGPADARSGELLVLDRRGADLFASHLPLEELERRVIRAPRELGVFRVRDDSESR